MEGAHAIMKSLLLLCSMMFEEINSKRDLWKNDKKKFSWCRNSHLILRYEGQEGLRGTLDTGKNSSEDER